MENEGQNVIRVGSRKSELALIQTNFVIDSLKKLHPDKEFTIVTMTTLGDRILDVSLPKIGEKSLFTKDLEDALRSNKVDFVVHSLKDLPTSLPEGLAIGAVFEREDPRDALVLREDLKDHTLASLPEGSVIGTSSLRRTAQLRGAYPQLTVTDVRGNLNTRLRKLDAADKQYSALLLAGAGLARMGWTQRISKMLPCAEIKYAVGQGALAVECCTNNETVLSMLAPFNHAETYCRILAERSFLKALGGGCSAPVGVSTTLKPFESQYKLSITGAVWSLDGKTKIDHTLTHMFTQIRKSHKHKLSPTEESDNKKIKDCETSETKQGSGNGKDSGHGKDSGKESGNGMKKEEETSRNVNTDKDIDDINPIEKLNRKIDEKIGDLNCEDTSISNEKPLFCGLTENPHIPLEVIVKCDSLGRELAEKLIEKGALEVMKVTQDLIRSSVGNKSS